MTVAASTTTTVPGLIAAAAAITAVLIAIFGPPLMSRLRPRDRPRRIRPQRIDRRRRRLPTPRVHLRSARRQRAPGSIPTEGS
jgi:hypothetical protein